MNGQDSSVRRLYRSRKDRVIAGVCGGVAEHFKIDPVLVRIVWVLAIFAKGLGLVAYVLCWILIPEREWSPAEATARDAESQGEDKDAKEGAGASGQGAGASTSTLGLSGSQPQVIIGVILIVLGCIFGLMAFVPFFSSQAFWAIVLIVLGLALIARR